MRPQYHLGMLRAGATLGAHQVVPAVALVQVRPFDPDRLALEVCAAVDQYLTWPDELALRQIELLNPDGAMAFVLRLALRRPVVQQIATAVVIEEQRRINAVQLRQ